MYRCGNLVMTRIRGHGSTQTRDGMTADWETLFSFKYYAVSMCFSITVDVVYDMGQPGRRLTLSGTGAIHTQ